MESNSRAEVRSPPAGEARPAQARLPTRQAAACTRTVLEQAEVLSSGWATWGPGAGTAAAVVLRGRTDQTCPSGEPKLQADCRVTCGKDNDSRIRSAKDGKRFHRRFQGVLSYALRFFDGSVSFR